MGDQIQPRPIDQYYETSITIRCHMAVIKDIKKKLSPVALSLFESTVFGCWLRLECFERDGPLIHALLLSEVNRGYTDRVVFSVRGKEIVFGREEFCLVTGMRFGEIPGVARCVGDSFRSRVFPTLGRVGELHEILDTPDIFDRLANHDVVRVCLLLLVHRGFLGREKDSVLIEPLVELVDDLEAWNRFPWGSVFWNFTLPLIQRRALDREPTHRATLQAGKMPQYSVTGFYYAFKIWIYEAFPETLLSGFASFKVDSMPRAVGWRRSGNNKWARALTFIRNASMPGRRPLARLVPTDVELASDWYRDSLPSLQSPWAGRDLFMIHGVRGDRVRPAISGGPRGFMSFISRPPVPILPCPMPIPLASRPPMMHIPTRPHYFEMPPPASTIVRPPVPAAFVSNRPPADMGDISRLEALIAGLRSDYETLSGRVTVIEGRVSRLWEDRYPDDVPLQTPVSSDIGMRVDIVSERVDVITSTPRDFPPTTTSGVAALEKDDRVEYEQRGKRPRLSSKYISSPFMFFDTTVERISKKEKAEISPLPMGPLTGDDIFEDLNIPSVSTPHPDTRASFEVNELQSGIICVHGYKVKQNVAPILESIFKKHGDIAAECVFKSVSARSSLLEVVCEITRQIQTDSITEKMEEIECQLTDAESVNINVSWIRAHFEGIRKRKEAMKKSSLLKETKETTILVKQAAQMDLRERCEELLAAQERFVKAERCVKVLVLVEKKLSNDILESKAEKDSWVEQPIL